MNLPFSDLTGFVYVAFFVTFTGVLAIVGYTIYIKGDFRAEVSRGRTVFKLEAKEKHSERNKTLEEKKLCQEQRSESHLTLSRKKRGSRDR